MGINVKDLIKNPGTTPFSRAKYIRIANEEQITEFMNGLFNMSVEAKDSGNWDDLDQYLEVWEQRLVGMLADNFQQPESEGIPWATLSKPLNQSKVALITTGGVYLQGQEPFDVDGDWSYREIPKETTQDKFRIAHKAYDTRGAEEDVNCVFPIERFRELEAQGIIGEFADVNYGFMGFIPKPEGLIADTAPEVARKLKEAGVDAVFIGTT